MTSQANGPPGLGLFAPFARALEVPARASSEAPLAKSLRGHTHTELMTVNPLRTPSLQERLHRVHRDRNAGWRRRAGARHEAAARAARPTSFCLATERLCGPPVGGTFWFQIFIQAPSPEIWSETISGGEEVLVGVALFLATSSEQFYFMGC